MAYCCDVERKKLQNRINRIHGQIHSLKNKFNDEKFHLDSDPYETIRQLTAIKGAVTGMIASYVEHYAKGHMIEQIKNGSQADAEAQIDNLLEIIKVYGK
ncbi:metal/formaldehyde-sensitive transcriptional repressor [Aliarcobacter lanthieri]|uniref:metal/formaldehyde-sensitive transcriptional repressor n=1 Tax=Arcobacteraceae TaxID=2808963 RepID=UPI00047B94B3|nr:MULTISPECIES: metal/formaldehyde-sensitive transcriptional repressor [Arcobacteraceae]MBL3520487.1 metal/formaldehyde-sensitive transcriptional repressor [Aliarcobacter lanthieri]QKF58527.1 transcriptional regulator, RcnR/FrmR family [Aliarcobacter lanthieri]RBQ27416.1 metal/formaldehyde-sensitive transcriptional repressor [Arcobacter sp. CECT 9188]